MLLNCPDGRNSINALYSVLPVSAMLGNIDTMRNHPPPTQAINHVYKLPSVEPAICYLHGAAGFPTKATWLKSIMKGNFLSWLLINIKNVNKHFPESEETQRGHMRSKRHGVRSTQPSPRDNAETGGRGGGLRGPYPLPLAAHVSALSLLRLWEVLIHIFDVY